jgi:hypothetical protein
MRSFTVITQLYHLTFNINMYVTVVCTNKGLFCCKGKGKGNIVPTRDIKAYWGSGRKLQLFLNSAISGEELSE